MTSLAWFQGLLVSALLLPGQVEVRPPPKIEPPKAEPPKAEAPKTESPKQESPKEDAARARARKAEEFRTLAALLSMNDAWGLETLDAARIARTIRAVKELRALTFDSDPALQRVGPPTVERYVQAETTVIPHISAPIGPNDDDETVMLKLGVELASAFYRNQVLRAWQTEHDLFCRDAYDELLDLARSLVVEKRTKRSVQVVVVGSGRLAQLQVRNESEIALSNVTLVLDLESATEKDAARAIYFFPTWEAGEARPVRIPAHWWHVGAGGTAGGDVEVVCDQFRTVPSPFHLPANVLPLAQKWLDEARAMSVALPPTTANYGRAVRDAEGALERLERLKRLRAHGAGLIQDAEVVRGGLQKAVTEERERVQTQCTLAGAARKRFQDEKPTWEKRGQLAEWNRRLEGLRQDVATWEERVTQIRQLWNRVDAVR